MKEILNHKVFRNFILVQKLILFIFHSLSLRNKKKNYKTKIHGRESCYLITIWSLKKYICINGIYSTKEVQ